MITGKKTGKRPGDNIEEPPPKSSRYESMNIIPEPIRYDVTRKIDYIISKIEEDK